MNRSVATLDDPEFINLKPMDINPLMSECDIKVCHTELNPNKTFISKEKLTEFAKTLRGCPIVGYYREEKHDFSTHGKVLRIDDSGIHIDVKTKPYGFVSPASPVWFQKFKDIDEFGNETVREYLMCKGFIWDGQYPEAKGITEEGRPQSMEFADDDSYSGSWTNDYKTNTRFFIINDAVFSKLCVLGDDVEPAMFGANVSAAENTHITDFTLDPNEFTKSLFAMMQQLQYALQKQGGHSDMADVNNTTPIEVTVAPATDATPAVEPTDTQQTDYQASEQEVNDANVGEEVVKPVEPATESAGEAEVAAEPAPEPEFEKKDDDDKKKDDNDNDGESKDEDNDDDDDDKKKDYSLLSSEYEELKKQFEELQTQYQALNSFKEEVETKQKQELIGQFYMLSDDDKKDVVEHITDYSLDDIKSKLAVICFEKKVNFDLENNAKNEDNMTDENNDANVVTYSLEQPVDNLPDWVKAVKSNMVDN